MTDNSSDGLSSAEPNSPAASGVVLRDRYIHSDVWDRLVQSPADLIGLVAYGLYQQRKREWIAFHEQKNGCLPAEDEVKAHSSSYRDTAIGALREEAEGALFRFSSEFAESQLPEMQRRAFNNRTMVEISAARVELQKISKDIADKTGYVHHIKTHIAGFVALAALAALITFALSFEKSPHELVKMLFESVADYKPNGH